MNIKEAKNKAYQLIKNAVSSRVGELKNTESYLKLIDQVKTFSEDPYIKGSHRQSDECGFLESIIQVDIGLLSEEDSEVIESIFESLIDWVHAFERDGDWYASVCLGYPIVYNPNASRHQYSIYCGDFSKTDRFDRSQVLNRDHAMALIERCMRKNGVSPNIVEVDYYGNVIDELSTSLGNLTDQELTDLIEKIEREADQK